MSNTIFEWEIVGARCHFEHADSLNWDWEEDCTCNSLDCTESLVGPCAREFCPMCFSNPELGEEQECCLPADEEQFYIGYKNANEEGADGARDLVNIPNNDLGINLIMLTQNNASISFRLRTLISLIIIMIILCFRSRISLCK